MKKLRKKLYFLDALRFIAFLCVIMYHFIIELHLKEIYVFHNPQFFYFMHVTTTMGVGLFFMISGAGLMLSSSDHSFHLKTYYRKRFFRICVPFYLVYISYLCFLFLIRRGWPLSNELSPWKIIFTLTAMDEYLALWGCSTFTLGIGEWFLGALMLMYLIFPLLRICMLRNQFLTLGAATVFYFIFVINYPFSTPAYMNFFVKIYDFIIGMFLIGTYHKIGKKSLFVTLPLTGIFLFVNISIPLPEAFKITILCTAVFLLAVQAENLISSCKPVCRLLELVRQYSFEVYLVHHIIIYQFGTYFAQKLFSRKEVLLLFLIETGIMFLLAFHLKKGELFINRTFTGICAENAANSICRFLKLRSQNGDYDGSRKKDCSDDTVL